ncbi:MAG: type II toxin-antitoxin system VapC family toxin, partial [Pseudomonadota bacterium]
IKRALDRPDFRTEPSVLRAGLLANGYCELAVEGRHCLGLTSLPRHHGDPFDRMLLVQAAAEGLLLVTADRRLGAYDGPVRLV